MVLAIKGVPCLRKLQWWRKLNLETDDWNRRGIGMHIVKILRRLQRDARGQDLIEYALMAGFVAVAVGMAFPTTLAPMISTIFSKVEGVVTLAASM